MCRQTGTPEALSHPATRGSQEREKLLHSLDMDGGLPVPPPLPTFSSTSHAYALAAQRDPHRPTELGNQSLKQRGQFPSVAPVLRACFVHTSTSSPRWLCRWASSARSGAPCRSPPSAGEHRPCPPFPAPPGTGDSDDDGGGGGGHHHNHEDDSSSKKEAIMAAVGEGSGGDAASSAAKPKQDNTTTALRPRRTSKHAQRATTRLSIARRSISPDVPGRTDSFSSRTTKAYSRDAQTNTHRSSVNARCGRRSVPPKPQKGESYSAGNPGAICGNGWVCEYRNMRRPS